MFKFFNIPQKGIEINVEAVNEWKDRVIKNLSAVHDAVLALGNDGVKMSVDVEVEKLPEMLC